MNQREREAMQAALEAFERAVATCFDQWSHEQVMSRPDHFINEAMAALRTILAEPDEQVKPLTIEEINNLPSAKDRMWPMGLAPIIVRLIREVETAHGIKEQK